MAVPAVLCASCAALARAGHPPGTSSGCPEMAGIKSGSCTPVLQDLTELIVKPSLIIKYRYYYIVLYAKFIQELDTKILVDNASFFVVVIFANCYLF